MLLVIIFLKLVINILEKFIMFLKNYAYPSHEMEKDEYWIKRWHDQGKLNFIEI
jgi:hypothetical protein